MRPTAIRILALTLVAFLFTFGEPAWAQRTTATFTGIVTDSEGGVLPGAAVELRNEGTGTASTLITSGTGDFVFNYVPVGTYSLTITMPGFRTYMGTGVPLGAGQSVRRTYVLEVSAIQESVTVTGEAPLVNAVSPEQRRNFERVEVESLPLANRNISNILNLAPGMTKQEAREGVDAVRFRLNGLGGSSLRVIANGTDANGNAGSPSLSQYQGFNKIDVVSTEAVAEAQVIKGVVPAEYGHAMAGALSIITKSGTNDWHGSLFHRYEGSALSARSPFLRTEPESRWNQFGGSAGGPIKRNRAFFFVAYEGYRQRTFSFHNSNVPTELLRQHMLTALPFPETRVLLEQYPLPTEPTAPGALTGVFIGSGRKIADDDHVDVRVDIPIWKGNLSGTLTLGHPFLSLPREFPTNARVYSSTTRRGSYSYFLSRGTWSSETRFGFNQNKLFRTDGFFNAIDPNRAETIPGARRVGVIAFPGLSDLSREQHNRGLAPSYSFEQQLALVKGEHSIKFGGIFSRPAGGRPDTEAPSVRYESLAELQANNPSRINLTLGVNEFIWRVKNFGFFIQDDWRVNNKLVLNLGLRYDFFGRYVAKPTDPAHPAGLFNLDGLLDRNFNFGPLRDPLKPIENDANNWQPRVGLAYDVDGGDTVIRGGVGVMSQPLDPQIFENQTGNTAFVPFRTAFTRLEAQQRGLRWPVYNEDVIRQFEGVTSGQPAVSAIFDPNIRAPYAVNFSLGLQRALTRTLVFETAYVGTRGYKFSMARTYNPVDRITGVRPNPALAEGLFWDDSQETNYHSWQNSLSRRFSNHLLFNANYTWSKALGITGGDISPGFIGDATNNVQDFFDLESERSPATGDVTHQFSLNWVYELVPFSDKVPVIGDILGGWIVAGVFRASTGVPLNISQPSAFPASRPDIADFDNAINQDCCGVGNLQYLNRAAFVRVPVSSVSGATIRRGNLGHHAFRGPGEWNLDLSLAKVIPMPGPGNLELRGDLLNALNHTNYTAIQTNVRASNFGQVTRTTPPRTIQVQARYSF